MIIISICLFVGSFFLVSPYSFVKFSFIQGMLYEAKHTAFGHGFKSTHIGLSWFNILFSPPLLDKLVLCLSIIGFIFFLKKVTAYYRTAIFSPEGILWLWFFFQMMFLVLKINIESPHYLLPVTPIIIILALQTLDAFRNIVEKLMSNRKFSVRLSAFTAFAIFVFELGNNIEPMNMHRQTAQKRVQSSIAVEAGNWLETHYEPGTCILYDHYSYVPPVFDDAHFTWGGTLELLNNVKPDVIIINQKISSRFSDMRAAPLFGNGEKAFLKIYQYYESVQNSSGSYSLVQSFGSGAIQIFERKLTT